MHRFVSNLAAMIAVATLTASTQAQTLGTDSVGSPGFPVGYAFFDPTVNFVIGQSFTLNQSVPLSSVVVYLHGNGTAAPQDQFKFELTNEIGPTATAANLLFSSAGTFPTTVEGELKPVSFAPPLTLAAGKYYIVLSSARGERSGWGTNGTILPSTLGTVDDGYVGFGANGSVGDYHSVTQNSINEDHLNFLVTALPEPATVALLPTCAIIFRRRRH